MLYANSFISRHCKWSLCAAAIALISIALVTVRATSQEVEKFNRFIEQSGRADKAMELFNEARDLINDDDWEGAEKAFRRFIDSYPKHKNVDAALYYMALAMKKQEKLEQSLGVIEWLLSHHPRSSWTDDAKKLRVEIAAQSGNGQAVEQELNKDDLETKIIALQAMFQSNPERAAQLVVDMLKADSSSKSRPLKEAALSLLGQYGGGQGVEMLIRIARDEKDARLRRMALFWLGQSEDERAMDLLKEMARSDDAEMSRMAIAALGQRRGPQARAFLSETARTAASVRARKEAILWLAQTGGEESIDELIKIYDADAGAEIRKQIIFALGQSQSARARAKLEELARSGDDESRKTAIFWLGQRDDQSDDLLAGLYDSERNEAIKRQIIFSLAQTGSKKALKKLFDIAKSDPSTAMRKQAIFWIGQSKDPEAMKFLEEILK
jgi:HEAT repeat protein